MQKLLWLQQILLMTVRMNVCLSAMTAASWLWIATAETMWNVEMSMMARANWITGSSRNNAQKSLKGFATDKNSVDAQEDEPDLQNLTWLVYSGGLPKAEEGFFFPVIAEK